MLKQQDYCCQMLMMWIRSFSLVRGPKKASMKLLAGWKWAASVVKHLLNTLT
jgi:hypothetical protein